MAGTSHGILKISLRIMTNNTGLLRDYTLHRKVAFVLNELGLSYESIYLDFDKDEHKAPEHTKYNPNGRIPTLIDHKENDFAVW